MRTYATWQMPQYVLRFYGEPLVLTRVSKGRYRISGPNRTDTFGADNAHDARIVARNIARYELDIKDRRVLRWKT